MVEIITLAGGRIPELFTELCDHVKERETYGTAGTTGITGRYSLHVTVKLCDYSRHYESGMEIAH